MSSFFLSGHGKEAFLTCLTSYMVRIDVISGITEHMEALRQRMLTDCVYASPKTSGSAWANIRPLQSLWNRYSPEERSLFIPIMEDFYIFREYVKLALQNISTPQAKDELRKLEAGTLSSSWNSLKQETFFSSGKEEELGTTTPFAEVW